MTVIGHEEQYRAFVEAWKTRRLHHAWLLSGPRGIGKRTFADAATRMILSGTDSFKAGADSSAAAKLAADAHPDFRLLERETSERTGALAQGIVVDQVRGLGRLLHQAPSLSDWRVVLIDAACEMNTAAGNALLKSLEEPPARTIFLLVCHAPGRLLATIRSRCRTLTFRPLSDDQVRGVLERELGAEADVDTLTQLAAGVPGNALRFAGTGASELLADLRKLLAAEDQQARSIALRLSSELARKPAQDRYEAFLDLAPNVLAGAVKTLPAPQLEAGLALWEEAETLARQARQKFLDPAVVTFQLARLVGRFDKDERQAA
ncbi:DNA polymerase III delta prime subunit [Pacificimonas flava]|uniref:DNA polymerase III delta prime subunit n=1 Tax=Pacificimonas flava TaxID=1234595 RepID=M2TRX4_9SPHN|nr:DNA polymerase III delta prime subunit [Pacificimonas flava]EMD84546.1 DNA polymerase III delta prime subunit [Pacificimonas flava]MBB5279582.1 DNA polymerase-3 subunit delta' [Pacificimonas flava]